VDLRKGFHEPVEKPRRFYRDVTVAPVDGGYSVLLDARRLKTPQAALMRLPTAALAAQVAEEWASQGEILELATMHATRLANTAIETISATRDGVADQIAEYAGSDLLCYFAESPTELVHRQQQAWEPVLARAEVDEGLRFVRAAGIVHRDQPSETIARVREIAISLDDFALAGLAFATPLFGSAMLAIGLMRGWFGGREAFGLSRVDEAFQESLWGIDAEAAERTARLGEEAVMLDRWFRGLSTPPGA
jgi:chaperone required for assembly of F1-ATPase